jgi:hypothetical protein
MQTSSNRHAVGTTIIIISQEATTPHVWTAVEQKQNSDTEVVTYAILST